MLGRRAEGVGWDAGELEWGGCVDGREGEVDRRGAGLGMERSQWRREPSEPPETRRGWTGCQATAIYEWKAGLMSIMYSSSGRQK